MCLLFENLWSEKKIYILALSQLKQINGITRIIWPMINNITSYLVNNITIRFKVFYRHL